MLFYHRMLPNIRARLHALLADEHGATAYSYLVVTFFMILIGTAVVGLAVPLALENTQAERMLVENNP